MAALDNDLERRLRDLNGLLDLALLMAVDVIDEYVGADHGVTKRQQHEALLRQAALRLSDAGRWPGRMSLFSDDEILVLRDRLDPAGGALDSPDADMVSDVLADELLFEMGRRGLAGEIRPAEMETSVPDGLPER